MEPTSFEQTGRDLLANYGAFKELRGLLGVTINRLAMITGLNTKTMSNWETAGSATNVRAKSAAAVGELYLHTLTVVAQLAEEDKRLTDFMPWVDVARTFGVSPNSYRLHKKCRNGELTCRDFGPLGVYVPNSEVQALRKAGF